MDAKIAALEAKIEKAQQATDTKLSNAAANFDSFERATRAQFTDLHAKFDANTAQIADAAHKVTSMEAMMMRLADGQVIMQEACKGLTTSVEGMREEMQRMSLKRMGEASGGSAKTRSGGGSPAAAVAHS